MTIEKILCTTDFSEPSYMAFDLAETIARSFSSELHLLYVVAPLPSVASHVPPSAFNMSLYQEEAEKHAWKSIKELAGERLGDYRNVKLHVEHGEPAHHIVNFAKKNGIDLIVMSTHGQSGWRSVLFGSVSEKVVRLSPVPVLAVPLMEG
jgi:nucleotide-binding universal stress UspA family protein